MNNNSFINQTGGNRFSWGVFNAPTSALIAALGYFAAWDYFWSRFEWSPFGHETCGLEFLVWPFFIWPLLVISYILKLISVKYYNYPTALFIFSLFYGILLSSFAHEKGLLLGCVCVLLILAELIGLAVALKKCLSKEKST